MSQQFIFDTHNKQVTLIYIGDLIHTPTRRDFLDIKLWLGRHRRHWPNNEDKLKKAYPIYRGYEIMSAKPSSEDLVWVLNWDSYKLSSDEISSWKRVLCDEKARTIFLFGEYKDKLYRMKKDLLISHEFTYYSGL